MEIFVICGAIAATLAAVVAAAGVFLNFRTMLRSFRNSKTVKLRDISLFNRAGVLGAAAGAAGVGLAVLVGSVFDVKSLGVAVVAGVAADSCRYLVDHRKSDGTYRGGVIEVAMLVACLFMGMEWMSVTFSQ
ncbi:hypothetical protein [Streptomyces sp. NPDC046985]|uniref:hypothetical protein n=1 Tax=Streptomyces sp. NPDC046985 TaxID=3155377 RepID=UPI0034048EEF